MSTLAIAVRLGQIIPKNSNSYSASRKAVELRKETRYLPTGARKIDRHITPWLARVSMTKSRTHVVVLASELLAARKEYRREVLAHPVTERKQRHEALSKVSHIKRVRARALTYFVSTEVQVPPAA